MKRCTRCLLPEPVPGSDFDAFGVCRPCRDFRPTDKERSETVRKICELDLEATLQQVRGSGQYDCLVPLSGGKDSVYLIYRLKHDYGLRVLAHTTDIRNGLAAEIADLDIEFRKLSV